MMQNMMDMMGGMGWGMGPFGLLVIALLVLGIAALAKYLSIAVWYGLTIGICTTFGAKLGPSLLRW